jgi:hypothetical protein
VSPDGRSVVTTSFDSTVRVWDRATGRQLATFDLGASSWFPAQFSPDGNLILVTTLDGKVRVLPWRAGGKPAVVSSGQSVNRAAFGPDGDRVLTGHNDGTARVWALGTAKPLAVLPPSSKENRIDSVASSPAGNLVATGSDDGTARLWRWHLPAVALCRGADFPEVGQADPSAKQHREPFDQGSLHAVGSPSILVDWSGEEHGDEVDIGAPRDGVASDDAAVEIGAVQTQSELAGQQARRRLGQALILGLHLGEVGLRADVTLGVKAVEVHPVIGLLRPGRGVAGPQGRP